MNSAGKYAVLAISAILIAGCATKKQTIPQPIPQAQAPSIQSGSPGGTYPPPLTPTTPTQATPPPAPQPSTAAAPPQEPKPEAVKPTKTATARKSKPSAAKTTPAVASDSGSGPANTSSTTSATPAQSSAGQVESSAPTQQTVSNQPASSSPIGQLTTSDPSSSAQSRRETAELIAKTEDGVKGIKRSLSAQEQETVNQIKTFLDKARQALGTDDVDGAHTLATKAKVLLDELAKS